MKPILPRTHGLIDYAACAAMLAAPSLLRLSPTARRWSYAFAGGYLALSALTDYPPALKRVIPFPVHGQAELATLPLLLLTAALRPAGRNRVYFLGLAGTVLMVYSLTDWQADPDAGAGEGRPACLKRGGPRDWAVCGGQSPVLGALLPGTGVLPAICCCSA